MQLISSHCMARLQGAGRQCSLTVAAAGEAVRLLAAPNYKPLAVRFLASPLVGLRHLDSIPGLHVLEGVMEDGAHQLNGAVLVVCGWCWGSCCGCVRVQVALNPGGATPIHRPPSRAPLRRPHRVHPGA